MKVKPQLPEKIKKGHVLLKRKHKHTGLITYIQMRARTVALGQHKATVEFTYQEVTDVAAEQAKIDAEFGKQSAPTKNSVVETIVTPVKEIAKKGIKKMTIQEMVVCGKTEKEITKELNRRAAAEKRAAEKAAKAAKEAEEKAAAEAAEKAEENGE